tara:strand:+ start:1156 stop:3189 length:2034 start_codon:yes stop_codon:yes gene_type:complete
MYTPVGSSQNTAQSLGVQAQQAQQSSGGVAGAIRAADASLQAKRNEARRIYERAQNQQREDLNTVAGFDASLAGADAAPAIQAAADELRQKIREANDPIEAQRLIGDFRQQFNTLQARETNRKEDAEQLNTMSTSTGSEMVAFNTALPPGMEYEEVDAGTVARADAAFQKNFQYVDGKIVVEGPEGNLVPIDQAAFINDTSAYRPAQRQADVGDLQTSAQGESIQARIKARGGGVFREKNAQMEFDTLAENGNRSGTVLRMQINEDYLDESGNSSFFDSPQEAKAFELGPNAFSRVEGNPELEQAWRDVWGQPGGAREKDDQGNIVANGSGWDLLNSERPKFVEYARFAMDSAEIERRKRIASGNKQEVSRYAVGSLAVNTEQRAQDALAIGLGANEQAPGYQMIAVVDKEGSSDPIQIEGSDLGISEGGKYLIQGFGVDPLYGINKDGTNSSTGRRDDGQQMASVTVKTERNQYKPFGGGEAISQEDYDQLSANDRALYEQSVVKEETQKRIPIGPGTSPEGEAIFNRLMRDPEAAALMQAEITKARKERGLYLNSLGEVKGRQEAEEQELQDQANERALANEQREQERQDQIRLDLANARRADERAEIIKGDSFKEENVVSQVGGRNVYDPPFMNAEIRDGKWFTSEGGDNPIGRVVIYQDENGKSQKGMAPLRG